MKPGWQTSEFWLTLAAVLIGVAIELNLFAETSAFTHVLAYVSQVLAVYGYTYSRGLVKSK